MHKQILTVNVEDYFHVWALRGSNAVLRKHWDRLDPRLDASLRAVLELLERHGARATFFVFGCIADRQPQIVESIMARGHEIASRGYWPRSLKGFEPSEFVDDLGRAKEALEAAGSNRIVGYRSPAWIGREHLWMLDELIEQGYQYDSSINPILLRFARDPFRWHVHQHWHTSKRAALWEVPISTAGMFGLASPSRAATTSASCRTGLFRARCSTRSKRARTRWSSTSCPGSSMSGSRTSRGSR